MRLNHKTLFCITNEAHEATNKLLEAACQNRGVAYVPIDPDFFRYDAPPALDGNMLYRVEKTKQAKTVEQFLLFYNSVATFYRTPMHGIAKLDNVIAATMLHEHSGIPIPKTFYGLPMSDQLEEVVASLGGFPIILKAVGGSHGLGVMRIDSIASLRSVADYLRMGTNQTQFILRHYIDVLNSARLIVLGDRVIDSIQYMAPSGDFRSNAGVSPRVTAKRFSGTIEDVAKKAVSMLGWEFGGVDILIDADEKSYVIEVNLPCFFPRCQNITGVDIAGKMVDYLLEKTRS